MIYKENAETKAIAQWGQYLLPESWLKRIEHANHIEKSLIARILLFKRLTTLGYDYTSLPEMKYTIQGKPYFDEDIHFSFTYNQDIIVLAVSKKYSIGIDVETIRPVSWQSFERYFCVEQWLKISKGGTPTRDLIAAWVTKEALNKLNGVQTIAQNDAKIRFKSSRIYLNGNKYYHQKVDLPNQFICKIVTEKKLRSISVNNLTRHITSPSLLYAVRA